MKKRQHQQGFTLVEVMVTLAILAIAAGFVVPSINSFFVNLRLKSSARTLFADLNLAKLSAMKTLRPHTVLLGGINGTKQGWVIFSDVNDSGGIDSGDKELRDVDLSGGITFQTGINPPIPITFDMHGLINRGADTYILESTSQGKELALTVSPTGFVRIH